MAKGKKKEKKSKKSKSKSSKVVSENDDQDPNVICSKGEFILPNTDSYTGEFCAHRQGIIWREGYGIYKTKDGQEYEGKWYNDKLLEGHPVEIRYPEGHIYIGLLARDKYNGPGTYYCSDVKISCNFENNKPHGKIALIDPLGEVYIGDARENRATLLPLNVLFENINPTRGIPYDSNIILEMTDAESMNTWIVSEDRIKDVQPQSMHSKFWKEVAFAKSKVTDTKMCFDESDWYKDWIKFKNTKERIEAGIASIDEQSSSDDAQWLREYEQYKQLRKLHKTPSNKEATNMDELLSIFKSSTFANSCPGVRVIYPSSTLDTFNSAKNYEECADHDNDGACSENRKSDTKSYIIMNEVVAKSTDERAKSVPLLSTSKSASRGKCLNRKNFAGGTNSMYNLVNNFLDNIPIRTNGNN